MFDYSETLRPNKACANRRSSADSPWIHLRSFSFQDRIALFLSAFCLSVAMFCVRFTKGPKNKHEELRLVPANYGLPVWDYHHSPICNPTRKLVKWAFTEFPIVHLKRCFLLLITLSFAFFIKVKLGIYKV